MEIQSNLLAWHSHKSWVQEFVIQSHKFYIQSFWIWWKLNLPSFLSLATYIRQESAKLSDKQFLAYLEQDAETEFQRDLLESMVQKLNQADKVLQNV
jgi:hypothetical protein